MKQALYLALFLAVAFAASQRLEQIAAWSGFDAVSMEAVLVNPDRIKARCREQAIGWFDATAIESAFHNCINVHVAQGYEVVEIHVG